MNLNTVVPAKAALRERLEHSRFAAELDTRFDRVLEMMRGHDLGGILVYSDAGNAGNVRYLTNYRPFFGVALLVVSANGDRILVNTFNWDAPRARLASGLERIVSGFDTSNLIAKALVDLNLGRDSRLGLVGANLIPYELHSSTFEQAGRPLPLDVHHEFEALRLIKSPLEQDLLRRAAAITDEAIEATMEIGLEGETEIELAAAIEYEMKRHGADGLAFPASIASGPNTEKPVSLPTSRRLEPGDLVMVDVGATWEGYAADITRTFVVGRPDERQRELYGAVAGTLETVTKAVEPGVAAGRLHRLAVQSLAEHGLDQYFTHRVGHGIGLETSLEAPDLQRDDLPLRPGMTFCLEPGVYIPGFGGIKIEDDVVVGTDGPEVISTFTRELVSI